MNYLSHFYIHQKENEPYYNTGLILPDLARGFVKSFKATLPEPNLELQALHAGCLQHYQADKIFHSSDFFKWGTQICIEELKQAKFHELVERRWFIGHVLFEMMLDRVLVQHKKQVLFDFYEQLLRVDDDVLKVFLQLNQSSEIEKLLQYFNTSLIIRIITFLYFR